MKAQTQTSSLPIQLFLALAMFFTIALSCKPYQSVTVNTGTILSQHDTICPQKTDSIYIQSVTTIGTDEPTNNDIPPIKATKWLIILSAVIIVLETIILTR